MEKQKGMVQVHLWVLGWGGGGCLHVVLICLLFEGKGLSFAKVEGKVLRTTKSYWVPIPDFLNKKRKYLKSSIWKIKDFFFFPSAYLKVARKKSNMMVFQSSCLKLTGYACFSADSVWKKWDQHKLTTSWPQVWPQGPNASFWISWNNESSWVLVS